MATIQERMDDAAAWWNARRQRISDWQDTNIVTFGHVVQLPFIPRRPRGDGERRPITQAAKDRHAENRRDPNPDVPLQSEAIVDILGYTTTLAVLPGGEVWDEVPDATPHADGFYVNTGRRRRQPRIKFTWQRFLDETSGPPQFFPAGGLYHQTTISRHDKLTWSWELRLFGIDMTEAYRQYGEGNTAAVADIGSWSPIGSNL